MTSGEILLGTVALEPNRWSTVDPSGAPSIHLVDWVDRANAAGFDGLEVWERHLADQSARAAVLDGPLPVTILNSYVDFDQHDGTERAAVARQAHVARSRAVKFNLGPHEHVIDDYADRLERWVRDLPDSAVALCECHEGTVTATDAHRTATLLARGGHRDRVQAIVHSHASDDELRRRFDAYGDRITHVHVNYLDPTTLQAPPLAERRDDLSRTVRLLRSLGFQGSWTIEFVHGLLTDADAPAPLLEQAIEDLGVLRSVVQGTEP